MSTDRRLRLPALRGVVGAGDLCVLGATAIWSVNVVVVKIALEDSGPLTYSAVRYVLGAGILCLLARRLEGPFPRLGRRQLALIGIAALAGVLINQASFTIALSLTSVGTVAMVSGTTPLLVAGWVAWHSGEHFGARVWTGLLMGFIGLALVVGLGAGTRASWLGSMVALVNPVSWALYLILLPRLVGRFGPLTLAALVTSLGALMLVPLGSAEAVLHPIHISALWLGLLAYSSIVALVLTSWLYLVGVRRLGPARTATYTYLQPFLTVLVASLVLGAPVLPVQVLGGTVMLAGVLAGRPRARAVRGPLSASDHAVEPGQLHPRPVTD